MGSLYLYLAFILVSKYAIAGKPHNLESRFGLTFSPTTIIASRFNSSGSIELITSPASSAYQKYYRDSVQKFGLSHHDVDEADVKALFQHAIGPITETLSKQIGHVPEYASLFLPSIFDYRTQISVAAAAIFQDPPYATKSGPSREVACYGYGFLECRNLGRPPHECIYENDLESLVLLLEYEAEYIYAWLLVVDFELEVYFAEQKRFCKDCGEESSKKTGEQAYQKLVTEFVRDVITNNVLPHHKHENVRAIVITGEASTEAVATLGTIALKAVGTKVVKLMTDIIPSEVVAHGAAALARMTQQHPGYFLAHTGNRIPDEQYWAEEEARKAMQANEHRELR